VQKAYETLSNSVKRQEYDNKSGFSSGSFQDFHQKRSTVFSDDEEEYKDLYRKDKRTMPNRAHQSKEPRADFWGDAAKKETKEQFRKQVFDDFDEFFDFK
jgi:curved DNA-binding protein CbpA